MGRTIDMAGVRRGRERALNAFRINPNVMDRLTNEVATMIYSKAEEPIVVSVRMPKALAEKVESLARRRSYIEDRRITRTSLMVELIREGAERLEDKNKEPRP